MFVGKDRKDLDQLQTMSLTKLIVGVSGFCFLSIIHILHPQKLDCKRRCLYLGIAQKEEGGGGHMGQTKLD